ncbi:unnamed protein product [Bemisia tabaci]|uniref:Deoxyuridine 5'-triphosphate nucleotidohydrolase n=1 Tax=Bemisia tabaci TaxID=7038 RepID=A0A9P0A2N9_BEMTA|nr:unnamed protein product [Bemisia tabaci]
MEIPVKVQKSHYDQDIPLPSLATPGAAGVDLHAAVKSTTVIPPNSSSLIYTGLRFQLPPNTKAEIRGRSSLAAMQVFVHNGLIDQDFLGEVCVLLYNNSAIDYIVKRGDRIAQLVFSPLYRPIFQLKDKIDTTLTQRGSGGFGSTGVSSLKNVKLTFPSLTMEEFQQIPPPILLKLVDVGSCGVWDYLPPEY